VDTIGAPWHVTPIVRHWWPSLYAQNSRKYPSERLPFLALIYFGGHLNKPTRSELDELKDKAALLSEMSNLNTDIALWFHIDQLRIKIQDFERRLTHG
jgi:hypothetical protein